MIKTSPIKLVRACYMFDGFWLWLLFDSSIFNTKSFWNFLSNSYWVTHCQWKTSVPALREAWLVTWSSKAGDSDEMPEKWWKVAIASNVASSQSKKRALENEKRSPIEPKSKHSKYVLVSMHCPHSKPQLLLGRLVMAGFVLLSTDGNTPRKSSLEGWVNSLKSSEQLVGASHGWKLRKFTVDDHVECKKAHMPFQSFCNSSCTQLLSPPSSPEPHVTTCSGCNARKLFI